jgi:DNA-binding winged helix-turn-helix (wHTH) protein/tetratricopeptide (TPR) repeat protein
MIRRWPETGSLPGVPGAHAVELDVGAGAEREALLDGRALDARTGAALARTLRQARSLSPRAPLQSLRPSARPVTQAPATHEFGPFRLDARKRVLWRAGELVAAPPKALDLLAVLVEQHGQVVTKDELLRRAWPDTFVSEANLSVNVAILRKALGTQADGRPWIQTVPRKGYRFVGAVASLAPPARRAIAVLPFRFVAASTEEDEALGLGMADALITRLSGSGRIVVRPTSAIQKYAGATPDPLAAGRELRVDAVLEGRLQREGERLRVSAQLLPTDGAPLIWAGQLEERRENLFALQDAIAERLAAALQLRPDGEQQRRLRCHYTESLEAYRSYVRGRFFWARFTPASLWKAVLCFREALALDPAYALPYAGLADAYAYAGYAGLLPPREAWDLADAALIHARGLDDGLAEVHVSAAFVLVFRDWDWSGAETALRRALAIDPDSASAHQWLGFFLQARGRLAEASLAIARAEELDPLSGPVASLRAFQHALEGDPEGQLAVARRMVELLPHEALSHRTLAHALQGAGDPAAAVDCFRRALDLAEGAPGIRALLARSLAIARQAAEARGLLADLEHASAGYVSPCLLAAVHLALGERSRALERVVAAGEARDAWVIWLRVDPTFAPLSGEPAFERLQAQIFGN